MASQVALVVKKHLPMQERQETWVQFPEDPLASHSSILAWRIPWTEEPGELQSIESQRVRQDWGDLTRTHYPCSMINPRKGTVSLFRFFLFKDESDDFWDFYMSELRSKSASFPEPYSPYPSPIAWIQISLETSLALVKASCFLVWIPVVASWPFSSPVTPLFSGSFKWHFRTVLANVFWRSTHLHRDSSVLLGLLPSSTLQFS